MGPTMAGSTMAGPSAPAGSGRVKCCNFTLSVHCTTHLKVAKSLIWKHSFSCRQSARHSIAMLTGDHRATNTGRDSHVQRRFGKLTEGERSFVLAHLATGVFGAGVAFAAVLRLGGGAFFARPMTAYEYWIVLAGALGAVLGLFFNRHRMGQGGTYGAMQAVGAVVLSNAMGAVIGGTLALPVYGTMFGPLALIIILISSPLLTLMWLANQLAAHILMARFHAERDSIFVRGRNCATGPV